MKRKVARKEISNLLIRCICAITGAALLISTSPVLFAQSGRQPQAVAQDADDEEDDDGPEQEADDKKTVKIPADQLDSLVAPIALYPDELLVQTLAASTYPLEIVQ